jgi:hypothetical protein
VSTAKQSHQNDDEIEQANDDILCCVCAVDTGDDNELIQCIRRSLFHCHCHEPPLRCPPRSTTWMCNRVRLNNVESKNVENTDDTNVEG